MIILLLIKSVAYQKYATYIFLLLKPKAAELTKKMKQFPKIKCCKHGSYRAL